MKTYFFLFLLCLPFLSYAQERKNPYTTIAGRITDQEGQPLVGAYIQASGGQAPQFSKNPMGHFNIPIFISKSQAVNLTITLEGYYLPNASVPNVYVVKPENRTDFLEIRLIKRPLPTGKKRIAVLPFCDDTNEKEDIALIDGAFTAEAANALSRIDETNLEAIPHVIVWSAMQRYNLRKGQYCDRDEINQIASDINANVVLIGMYQKETLGNQTLWRVTGSFFDLENNQSFCRNINETAVSLPLLQKKLYQKVLEVLQINTTSEATAILESQTTQTTQNENSYMHTLNSSQYNTQQEPQRAKEEATKAIKEDNNNYNAYQQRAVAEASTGNTEAAQKDYQKAQEKAEKKGVIKKVIDWIKEKVVNPITKNTDLPTTKTLPNEIKLIKVEGGSFMMGCDDKIYEKCYDDEKPLHKVTLTDYYIGQTEVTNAQYAEFLNEYESDEVKEGEYKGQKMIYEYKWGVKKENGIWKPQTGYKNHPVIYVTWFGANEFCRYYKGFLPSEAQWEYAARGGSKSNNYKYAGSNNPDEVAWHSGNTDNKTDSVKTRKPNELGLYDMSGNVWEWCQDWYDEKYYENNKIITNPINNSKANRRILRGGSFWYDTFVIRSVNRNNSSPTNRVNLIGFRICLPSI